jgi:hypothetical protein
VFRAGSSGPVVFLVFSLCVPNAAYPGSLLSREARTMAVVGADYVDGITRLREHNSNRVAEIAILLYCGSAKT